MADAPKKKTPLEQFLIISDKIFDTLDRFFDTLDIDQLVRKLTQSSLVFFFIELPYWRHDWATILSDFERSTDQIEDRIINLNSNDDAIETLREMIAMELYCMDRVTSLLGQEPANSKASFFDYMPPFSNSAAAESLSHQQGQITFAQTEIMGQWKKTRDTTLSFLRLRVEESNAMINQGMRVPEPKAVILPETQRETPPPAEPPPRRGRRERKVREKRQKPKDPRKREHEQWGDLSLKGWLHYMVLHSNIESTRIY